VKGLRWMKCGRGLKMQQTMTSGFIGLLALAAVFGTYGKSDSREPSQDKAEITRGDKLLAEPGKGPGAFKAEGGTLVILGASYVRAWPVQELGGMKAINKGVNGEQSFEMLQRFGNDVIALKPRAVIIWGFINDIHRTGRENIDAAMAGAKESIAEMVRLARVNGIDPILATEVTIRGKDDLRSMVAGWLGAILKKKSYQSYVNGHVLDTNRWIRKYADENGIPLLDFQPLIADEKGFRKKEFATEDGTHISEAAYKRLSEHAEKVLGRFFEKTA
jgi:lysophospholipase L1-like esterase